MIRRVSQLGSGITPSADNFSREQLAISCPRLFLFPFSLIDARNNFESRFVLFLLSVFPRLDSRFVFAFMAVSFFRIYITITTTSKITPYQYSSAEHQLPLSRGVFVVYYTTHCGIGFRNNLGSCFFLCTFAPRFKKYRSF